MILRSSLILAGLVGVSIYSARAAVVVAIALGLLFVGATIVHLQTDFFEGVASAQMLGLFGVVFLGAAALSLLEPAVAQGTVTLGCVAAIGRGIYDSV